MQHSKFFVFAFSAFLSSTAFGQQTKIEVKKGQQYKVETTTKVSSTAEVMGQSMENSSDNNTTTTYDVLDVETAELKLESKIIKMVVTASAMGQTMNYDSDKKDNEGPLNDALSKLLNKARTVKLDSKGLITKQDAPEDDTPGMMGVVGSGKEATIELFIPALIGKDLKVGDSYPDVSEVKQEKYNSRDSGSYKITAIDNGVASVSYSGTQAVSMVMEQMGMEMTNNSNNIIKHELQMDMKTGRVLVKASVTESDMTIEAGGMSIPAKAKTTMTTTITQLK